MDKEQFNSEENQLNLLWKESGKELGQEKPLTDSEEGISIISSKTFDKAPKQSLAIDLIKEIAKQYKLKIDK